MSDKCTSVLETDGVKRACGLPLVTLLHDERTRLCMNCDIPHSAYGSWVCPRIVPVINVGGD